MKFKGLVLKGLISLLSEYIWLISSYTYKVVEHTLSISLLTFYFYTQEIHPKEGNINSHFRALLHQVILKVSPKSGLLSLAH